MIHNFSENDNFCITISIFTEKGILMMMVWFLLGSLHQTKIFSYVWKIQFVGQGIYLAPKYFIYKGILLQILPLSKKCSCSSLSLDEIAKYNLDIAQGQTTISIFAVHLHCS